MNNIKILRAQKGMSQSQLAEELEITQATLARIENGKIKLSVERSQQIAAIFEVDQSVVTSKNDGGLNKQVQQITNEYLERIVKENKYLREEVVMSLKREIEALKKQNKQLGFLLNQFLKSGNR